MSEYSSGVRTLLAQAESSPDLPGFGFGINSTKAPGSQLPSLCRAQPATGTGTGTGAARQITATASSKSHAWSLSSIKHPAAPLQATRIRRQGSRRYDAPRDAT